MGEYGFDRGNDAGIDATAQMPGADGYPGYSPGHGEGNPAPAKTMVTRRRAVVTAILCSMFAFGVSAAYAESSKGNAGDKAWRPVTRRRKTSFRRRRPRTMS